MLERCLRENLPIPEKIAQVEYLPGELRLFYTAFVELNADRSVDGGRELLIPWTAIKSWCDEYDIQGEQREEVLDIVRGIDIEYVRWAHDRQKRAEARGNRKRKKVKGRGRK